MLDRKRNEQQTIEFYNKEYRKKHSPLLKKRSSPAQLFDIYSQFQVDRLRLIRPYLGREKKLLDIGCSAATFLYQAKDYVKEIAGVEYDQASANFAAKKCSCKIFNSSDNLPEDYFDIICLLQVLEHVYDPKIFLKKALKSLKKNGILFIEVPNLTDSLLYAYDIPNYNKFFFHSAHLSYFTEKSLSILMGKVGLKGKMHFIQDYNIFNHLNWILKGTPQKNCIAALSPPELKFKNHYKELEDFFCKADSEYKDLLSKLKIASLLCCIGTRK
ncbi:class I SAM-dependent methyltransferase [Candidatus Omnitrophota bacterium]